MEEYRNIIVVIDRLLTIIPATEVKLINELVKYKDGRSNQAPEALYCKENWIPAVNILQRNITELDTEWKKTVHKIFINAE